MSAPARFKEKTGYKSDLPSKLENKSLLPICKNPNPKQKLGESLKIQASTFPAALVESNKYITNIKIGAIEPKTIFNSMVTTCALG